MAIFIAHGNDPGAPITRIAAMTSRATGMHVARAPATPHPARCTQADARRAMTGSR